MGSIEPAMSKFIARLNASNVFGLLPRVQVQSDLLC